jgi:hypothetical protein
MRVSREYQSNTCTQTVAADGGDHLHALVPYTHRKIFTVTKVGKLAKKAVKVKMESLVF